MRKSVLIGLCCALSSCATVAILHAEETPATSDDLSAKLWYKSVTLNQIALDDACARVATGIADASTGKDAGQEAEAHGKAAIANLGACVSDPELGNLFLSETLQKFHRDKFGAKGAVQVCQVAAEQTFQLSMLQVQQNQRIIALLEQIANRKAAAPSQTASALPVPKK